MKSIGFGHKNVRFLVVNIRQCYQFNKTNYMFKRKRKEEKFWGKSQIFNSFLTLIKHVFNVMVKTDQQRCQNCIRYVQGNILMEKNFVEKIVAIECFSGLWVNFCWTFPKGLKISSGLSKLQLSCPDEPPKRLFLKSFQVIFVFGLWVESFWILA